MGTKLTEEEYALLEAVAAKRGLTVGEWCREELLRGASNGNSTSTTATSAAPIVKPATSTDETLLAEILALRTILLNLFYDLAGGGKIHADRMEEVIAKADGNKWEKARERFERSVAGVA